MREVGEMGGGGRGHFIGAEKEGDRAFMAVFKARRRIAAVMDGGVIWGRSVGADVGVPRVSDRKRKKERSVPVCAGWAGAGPCLREGERERRLARWAGPEARLARFF